MKSNAPEIPLQSRDASIHAQRVGRLGSQNTTAVGGHCPQWGKRSLSRARSVWPLNKLLCRLERALAGKPACECAQLAIQVVCDIRNGVELNIWSI